MTALLCLPAPRTDWLLPAPVPTLSYAARQFLIMAYKHQHGYFPVHSRYNDILHELVVAGAFEHHPEKRKRTWYGITSKGRVMARQFDRETKAMGFGLMQERMADYERLREEMRQRGYFVLPEPERGPDLGEVAFFNPTTGRKELYRCRINHWQWEIRRGGYYPAYEAAIPVAIELDRTTIDQIPF